MQTATETERKYDVPADFELPSLKGSGEAATHDLDATYFDTGDLRLARNKRTLRKRSGGTDAGWHLKTPGTGSSRTEHRLPLDGDAVPGELLAEVRALVRDVPLAPVARLRTTRVETPLLGADGRVLALIAQDQVVAETDGVEQRWQEVEVELVDGDRKLLDTVERKLRAAGATPAAGPSKLARALGDRLRPSRTTTKINPVLSYAREQRDAIQEYDPGVRRGDPDAVHKMRVATRRLRSTLKTFRRSFPAEAVERLGPELKWLAAQLGTVRDGQVQEGKLLAEVPAAADPGAPAGPDFGPVEQRIREHLDLQVDRGRAELSDDLESERYLRLLDAVDALVDTPGPAEPHPLARARKALVKADRLLDEATLEGADEPLHEARKAYKRARYAVEVFAPRAGRPGKQLITRLTELQDVLGAHQDSVVARELLHELATGSADGFPYGILYARQQQIGRDTLLDLPAVTRQSRKRKLRSWLG